MNESLAPLAYTIDEAVRLVPIGRSSLYELISAGKLESRKIGKRRYILADSLRRLVETGCEM